MQARIDKWNKVHPGEEVKFIELPVEADQRRIPLINAARISPSAYNVVSPNDVWVSKFAVNRWTIELPEDELKGDDILESVWKIEVYKDRVFAVPYATDAPVMLYHKDLLAQASVAVPKTWEEVEAATGRVRALSDHKGIGGFGGQLAKYENPTCRVSEFIHITEGGFYNDNAQAILDPTESVADLQWLISGLTKGYIPKESLEQKEEDGRSTFESGGLLFYQQWPYRYINNKEFLGPDKFDVVPLPSIDGKPLVFTLGGYNCATIRGFEDKVTVLKFVERWIDGESQCYSLKAQANAPILRFLYDDPELLREFPYLSALKKNLEDVKSRPQTVYYGGVTAEIQDNTYPAIQQPGSRPSKDVIAGLSSSLKKLGG